MIYDDMSNGTLELNSYAKRNSDYYFVNVAMWYGHLSSGFVDCHQTALSSLHCHYLLLYISGY